jgi:hypothetical protein
MDVFMSNLPSDLSDRALKRVLSTFLSSLGITDWACQKQRKKSFGIITFLHPSDAEKFLCKHGEQPTGAFKSDGRPRMAARIVIMKRLVFCRKSTHDADPFMLKSLHKDAYDRRDAEM